MLTAECNVLLLEYSFLFWGGGADGWVGEVGREIEPNGSHNNLHCKLSTDSSFEIRRFLPSHFRSCIDFVATAVLRTQIQTAKKV